MKFSVLMNVLIDDAMLLTHLVMFSVLMNVLIDNKVSIWVCYLQTHPDAHHVVTCVLV